MSAAPPHKPLPVDRFAERIKDSVHNNAVTLIIGQTGCGKSSRVPQMLQQELGGAVICTQPRRLAVVAIASHVANVEGCELGQEVGFRIGQKSVASRRTCMMFTTAGLLMEELRANGAAALKQYRCLIIDELHERSVESDLLLACLHALFAAGELPTLKLVLMSATANVERYQTYFKLPGDHVALIRLDMQRLTTAIGEWLETVKVVYLDQVVDKLLAGHRNNKQHKAQLKQHKAGDMAPYKQIAQPMSLLMRDLILHIHSTEPDPDGVILVFLPTFKALLLQHKLLLEAQQHGGSAAAQGSAGGCEEGSTAAAAGGGGTGFSSSSSGPALDVFALHSSVDIDEALEAIQGPRVAGRRRVVLATNCAESSITLPNVKHVIDSCTANQVYWDPSACREYARVIWASQSAAQQRAGRTGRTCPGTCYRLMTRPAFNALPKYEASALTLRSLRREVLCLLSASSKVLSDPQHLLGQALDAPEPDVVEAAVDYLQQIGAAQPNAKGKLEPTLCGNFLAALPISLDSGLLLVQGGLQGLTREAAVLAALLNTSPFPIAQPFGADAMKHVKQYSGSGSRSGRGNGGGGSSGSSSGMGHGLSTAAAAVDCAVEVDDCAAAAGFGFGAGKLQERRGVSTTSGSSGSSSRLLGYSAGSFFNPQGSSLNSSSSMGSNSLSAVAGGAGGGAAAAEDDGRVGSVSRAQLLLANMAALHAWQQQWCDPQLHLQALQADDQLQQQPPPRRSEAESLWCKQHNLLPSSLRAVQDLLGVLYSVIHRFRPCFVQHAVGPPAYFTNKSPHRCDGVSPKQPESPCGCEGLDVNTLMDAGVCRQLQALLQEVTCGGTAEADIKLLQTRLDSIHQHSSSSASTSSTPSASSTSLSSSMASLRLDDSSAGAPVCKYFLAGSCVMGSSCSFSHTRPMCRFFFSRTGCSYGSSCRFLHGSSAASTSSSNLPQEDTTQPQQNADAAGLWFEWGDGGSNSSANVKKGSKSSAKAAAAAPPVPVAEAYKEELLSQPPASSSGNSSGGGSGIVLLGEGDLSFAAALVAARQAAGLSCSNITATVLEQNAAELMALYPRSKVSSRLLDLIAADVSIEYGIDATQLMSTGSSINWRSVGALVWNLPFATAAESTGVPFAPSTLIGECDEANKALMSSFMMAAARLLLCCNPHMKVHIALCNEQYGRWGMEALSRSCFMFLEASKPLNLQSWPGYSPKRGQLDNAFPADRCVVYTFGLHLPQACSELAVKSRVLGVHLQQLHRRAQAADGDGAAGRSAKQRQQQRAGDQQQEEDGMWGSGSRVVGAQDSTDAARGDGAAAEEGLGDVGLPLLPGLEEVLGRS